MTQKNIFYLLFLTLFTLHLQGSPADFLSVKVHYLSGKDAVVLNANNNKDERVEIFVSLLDKNGDFATTGMTGEQLIRIANSMITSKVDAKKYTLNDIDRDVISDKNTARFVLDYTDVSTKEKEDILTVQLGGLKKDCSYRF